MIRKRSEAEKTFYSICTLMNAIQLVCPKEYGFFSYFFFNFIKWSTIPFPCSLTKNLNVLKTNRAICDGTEKKIMKNSGHRTLHQHYKKDFKSHAFCMCIENSSGKELIRKKIHLEIIIFIRNQIANVQQASFNTYMYCIHPCHVRLLETFISS